MVRRTKQDSMVRIFKCYETFYKPNPVELKEGLGTLPHYIDKVILGWWTMESRERLDQVTMLQTLQKGGKDKTRFYGKKDKTRFYGKNIQML
jgi:hypothetical protein